MRFLTQASSRKHLRRLLPPVTLPEGGKEWAMRDSKECLKHGENCQISLDGCASGGRDVDFASELTELLDGWLSLGTRDRQQILQAIRERLG